MRFSARQGGYTLIEMVIVLSISAVVMIPLTGIVASQILKAPARVRGQLTAAHQAQNVVVNLAGDALAAQEFIPGNTAEQEYGTFKWFELSGDFPVAVSARYFWEDGRVFRQASFAGGLSPAQVAINNVAAYEDVTFTYTPSEWVFDPVSKKWQYSQGRIDVMSAEVEEAGAVFTDNRFHRRHGHRLSDPAHPPSPVTGPHRAQARAASICDLYCALLFSGPASGQRQPRGLTINTAVDPPEVWVVNEGSNDDDSDDDSDDDGGGTDEVFRYSQQGVFLGTVSLTTTNRDSKGITTDGASFWVLDKETRRYTATSWTVPSRTCSPSRRPAFIWRASPPTAPAYGSWTRTREYFGTACPGPFKAGPSS